MIRRMPIGRSGMTASALSLGTWAMGGGSAWTGSDDKMSVRMLHEALERGIDLIDTAPLYGVGHSEEIVGKAVKDRRGDYILATKCGVNWRSDEGTKEFERDGQVLRRNLSPAAIRQDLHDSLRRLGTDYIDIYITHRQPEDGRIEEVASTLASLKQEGLIRAIGISNSTVDHYERYSACVQVDVVQEKYSILDRHHEAAYIPLCERNGTTFQTYSSLARGLLTGKFGDDYVPAGDAQQNFAWFEPGRRKRVLAMLRGWSDLCDHYQCSLANLALAYVLSQSAHINLLFGARRPDHLIDTIRTLDVALSAEHIRRMRDDAERLLHD